MPNVWIRALKKYNENKPKYTVPKKGTVEYAKVKKIMEKMKKSS